MVGGGPALVDVIIVAAGMSQRMGGTDKLMAEIGGRPVLAWTLDAFDSSPVVARIVVVTSHVEAVESASWLPERVTQIVDGGPRRQESVGAGFEELRARTRGHADDRLDRVVLVHDGARPVVSQGLIESVARAAAVHGAAIPVVPIGETVKRIDGERVTETIDRSSLAMAQTPQGVRASLMWRAYEQYPPSGPQTWTDEAALLEACRIPVHVVPGDSANLKVTVPADLARAASLLTGADPSRRTGIGHDAHPFGPGEPLRLGGIEVSGAPRLHGHSDGDVVLHAVADALLGAAGLGDLGRLFPADASTPAGIDSATLLTEVVARLAEAGWRPSRVDLTIVAHRPRLDGYRDAMRVSIAGHLGLGPEAVNVKASTGNLDGSEGAGRSISTLALATIEARA